MNIITIIKDNKRISSFLLLCNTKYFNLGEKMELRFIIP